MARYIDLDKVNEYKNSYCNTTSVTHCNRDCAECFYNHGGAEDVAPVVHAKWEHKNGIYGVVYCSHCDFELKGNNTNYCSDCGAKMDKE